MSDTTTKKIALTEKQLSWTYAFMKALGMQGGGDLNVKVVGETQGSKIKGNIEGTDKQVEASTAEGLKDNSGVTGSGEKVGRRFHGAGKGYKTDVVNKVNAVLKRADELGRTGQASEQIQKLIEELTEARNGYEERKEGETSKSKLDQRERKVKAIEHRVAALEGLLDVAANERFKKINSMDKKERTDALLDNPAILRTLARSGGGKELDELFQDLVAKPEVLRAKPEVFGAFLETRPPNDVVLNLMNGASPQEIDALVTQVIDVRGNDKTMMNALCKGAVAVEAAKPGAKETFFRGNSVATKLTKAFAVSGEESEEFLDDAVTARNAMTKGMPKKVEIDPVRMTDVDEGERAELVKDSLKYIEDSCRTFLATIYKLPIPDNVATTAFMIAGGAKSKKFSNEEIGIMIGGHLLLRIINPLLTNAPKSPGVNLAANEMRLMVLVSKTIQNISNHKVRPENAKEVYMLDLVNFTEAQIPMMDQWCAKVAVQGGKALRG